MNLADDPNQQTRPSIFGDCISHAEPSNDWNRFAMSNNYYSQPNFPFTSNFGPNPVTFPINTNKNDPLQRPTFNPFPSTSQTDISSSRFNMPFRCKRKTESPPPVMTKQHITEEKMAEHLSKLHISSETASSNEPEDRRIKRLYMCEEMRKLQTDSILPSSLLNKLQSPCTALVLWQPPQRLLPDVHISDNNNEEEVPDNNLMDTDGR